MTTERAVAVAVRLDGERRLLIEDLRSAAARAEEADPGDRLDVVRFETLSSQLEAWAFRLIDQDDVPTLHLPEVPPAGPALITDGGVPSWVPDERRADVQVVLEDDGALVLIVLPLEPGERSADAQPVGAPPPAKRWKSETGSRGSKAVEERFKFQLARATSEVPTPEPFSPSGIQNRVLTEALRDYVHAPPGARRVDAPVEYRDGSRAAHPFPLRSVPLLSKPSNTADLELSFSLLSVRHAELDAIVDGAWLRNSQISQTRAAAETDNLVYDISWAQLQALTNCGARAVALRMYQTGLETAIVGFYRAVTNHLIEYPGILTVTPMFYRQPQENRSTRGESGRNRRSKARPPTRVSVEPADAEYSAGEAWTAGGRKNS